MSDIDKRIAEEVMGWEFHCLGLGDNPRYRTGSTNAHPSGYNLEYLPHFSTDIKATFLVVEKMREDGYTFLLYDNEDGDWFANFGETIETAVAEETIPMAICLAALKTKENKT